MLTESGLAHTVTAYLARNTFTMHNYPYRTLSMHAYSIAALYVDLHKIALLSNVRLLSHVLGEL